MKTVRASLLIAILLATVTLRVALAADAPTPQVRSQRSFDETVQQLNWVFGAYGLTTVVALDYQKLLKKVKVDIGRAAVFEIMRREWATTLLRQDAALGFLLPLRVYVFEQADGTTVVSYSCPGAYLEGHANQAIVGFGRQLDEKLRSIVLQATSKPSSGQKN
jgi:uncharacterized protein (DUF302 family)